jgi:hypothetical protein
MVYRVTNRDSYGLLHGALIWGILTSLPAPVSGAEAPRSVRRGGLSHGSSRVSGRGRRQAGALARLASVRSASSFPTRYVQPVALAIWASNTFRASSCVTVTKHRSSCRNANHGRGEPRLLFAVWWRREAGRDYGAVSSLGPAAERL